MFEKETQFMKIVIILIATMLLTACNTNTSGEYLALAHESVNTQIDSPQEHPGKKLMENNCYVCHDPQASEDRMMAPPMIAIKKHYISADTTKEEFINAMLDWSKKPSEEKSKMPGAIKKFGLMPYQFFPENTMRQIADYMFDNKIEEPEWFQEHFNKMQGMGKGKKGKG